jgi:hypothetical protein
MALLCGRSVADFNMTGVVYAYDCVPVMRCVHYFSHEKLLHDQNSTTLCEWGNACEFGKVSHVLRLACSLSCVSLTDDMPWCFMQQPPTQWEVAKPMHHRSAPPLTCAPGCSKAMRESLGDGTYVYNHFFCLSCSLALPFLHTVNHLGLRRTTPSTCMSTQQSWQRDIHLSCPPASLPPPPHTHTHFR